MSSIGCYDAPARPKPGPDANHRGQQRPRPRDCLPAERAPAAAHQLQDPAAWHRRLPGADLCGQRPGMEVYES